MAHQDQHGPRCEKRPERQERARAVHRYDNYTDGQSRGYPVGRRSEMWNASGHTIWIYDVRGRVIEERRYIDSKVYVTKYEYDAMDRATKITYPDNEVVNLSYNAQLLLDSMIGSSTYVAAGTGYNAAGQPTGISYNGVVTTMGYHSQTFRLISISAPGVGLSLEYAHLPNGNIQRVTEGSPTDFGYDAMDRLTSASGGFSAAYAFNQIGNILSKAEGGTSHTYVYGDPNHKHAPLQIDGVDQGYDPNGNLTSTWPATVGYSYNAENQLVKITGSGGYVARFSVDGDGRRAKRLDAFGTVHYPGPHYERNVGTGADTTEVITKLYWAQLGPYRRLIAVRRTVVGGSETLNFLHHDHLGSTKAISGTSGGPYKYYPFGYAYQEVQSPPTDNLYTGQKRDLSTGLYFYGARYYNPAIGMFVQPDSIVPQPGNPQSLNRYSYVLNNPLKYTDPTGHAPIDHKGTEPEGLPPDVKPPDPDWDPDWYEAYKAAHSGAAPTQSDWQDRLLSLRWAGSGPRGAWTEQDWQDYTMVRGLLGGLADQIGIAGDVEAVGFYSSLGLDLARGTPVTGPDQTLVVRSDRIPPGAGAITLGRVIALRPNVSLTRELLIHEYIHVLQYRAYGWKVLPDYLREGPWNWDGNRYEQLAMKVEATYAGNPYLPPLWAFPRR